MTDKNIKRFTFDVWVKDSGSFATQYSDHMKRFTDDIRSQGYIPVLDLDPVARVDYDEKRDVFHYSVTIQAIYIGRKKSWLSLGIQQNRILPDTVRTKSKQSFPK